MNKWKDVRVAYSMGVPINELSATYDIPVKDLEVAISGYGWKNYAKQKCYRCGSLEHNITPMTSGMLLECISCYSKCLVDDFSIGDSRECV